MKKIILLVFFVCATIMMMAGLYLYSNNPKCVHYALWMGVPIASVEVFVAGIIAQTIKQNVDNFFEVASAALLTLTFTTGLIAFGNLLHLPWSSSITNPNELIHTDTLSIIGYCIGTCVLIGGYKTNIEKLSF